MNEAAYRAILERLKVEPPTTVDWNAEYHTLARITNGIVKEDPRFPLIITALDRCDLEYFAGDWLAFQQAALAVHRIVEHGPK